MSSLHPAPSGEAFAKADHLIWNSVAIAYTLLAYGLGIRMLFLPLSGWTVVGILLLTHSLVYSAYFVHEFMHGTIFRQRWGLSARRWNAIFGSVMLWLNGGCYARFEELTRIHIGHHLNRADFMPLPPDVWLSSFPGWIRQTVVALEWMYIPVISFMYRWRFISSPFWMPSRHPEAGRVLGILVIRGSLLILLAWFSWQALVFYALAYVGMIQILRFMDAFQHTYEVIQLGSPVPQRDEGYEQANTFSNVMSLQFPWMNVLVLNFCYHNAHHQKMQCPWYRLPSLDRHFYPDRSTHKIPFAKLIGNFHRFRVARFFRDQGQAIDSEGNLTLDQFYGAGDISFLVVYT